MGWLDTDFIPKVLLGVSFSGIVVSASCYLFTEFALRPVAAQALEVGPPPRRFAPGIMGRTMTGVGARFRSTGARHPAGGDHHAVAAERRPRPNSPSP